MSRVAGTRIVLIAIGRLRLRTRPAALGQHGGRFSAKAARPRRDPATAPPYAIRTPYLVLEVESAREVEVAPFARGSLGERERERGGGILRDLLCDSNCGSPRAARAASIGDPRIMLEDVHVLGLCHLPDLVPTAVGNYRRFRACSDVGDVRSRAAAAPAQRPRPAASAQRMRRISETAFRQGEHSARIRELSQAFNYRRRIS